MATYMYWREYSGSWVLIPSNPLGIIHFLGGAFIGTAPNITYRWLLEELGKQGYVIIATSFLNTLDHKAIAVNVQNRLENVLARLQYNLRIDIKDLPVYETISPPLEDNSYFLVLKKPGQHKADQLNLVQAIQYEKG